MDADKLTSRSVEVVNAAQTAAVAAGNAQTEPLHLAFALLRQDGGLTPSLLTMAGVDVVGLKQAVDEAAVRLPKASGATVQTPGASGALTRVLAKALELAEGMKDDYVATEHLLLALLREDVGGAARTISELGIDPDAVRDRLALAPPRGPRAAS